MIASSSKCINFHYNTVIFLYFQDNKLFQIPSDIQHKQTASKGIDTGEPNSVIFQENY